MMQQLGIGATAHDDHEDHRSLGRVAGRQDPTAVNDSSSEWDTVSGLGRSAEWTGAHRAAEALTAPHLGCPRSA